MKKIMIICEVGLNHNGNEKYAKEYVDAVIKSKTDAIVFHIREESFYHGKNKKKKLSDGFYRNAREKVRKEKIKFGVTIADVNKISFCESIDVDFYKIWSLDINNKELITELLKSTNKKIFVSTGLSDLNEINKFVRFVKNRKKQFTLIHTQLRPNLDIVNLKAIPFLKEKYKMPIAFGNHCENLNVIYVSLGFEPSDIFFYVKGNKTKKHQDDTYAVSLSDLSKFIKNLKKLEKSIGIAKKLKMNLSLDQNKRYDVD